MNMGDFKIAEQTDIAIFIACTDPNKYILHKENGIEIFLFIWKKNYCDYFEGMINNKIYECIEPQSDQLSKKCTFKDSFYQQISPKDKSFIKKNFFACKNRPNQLIKAFCITDEGNKIIFQPNNLNFDKPLEPGLAPNEVNLYSMCRSDCPVIDVEIAENVNIVIAEISDGEEIELTCSSGLVFSGYKQQSTLKLLCDTDGKTWKLKAGLEEETVPGIDFTKKLVIEVSKKKFICVETSSSKNEKEPVTKERENIIVKGKEKVDPKTSPKKKRPKKNLAERNTHLELLAFILIL